MGQLLEFTEKGIYCAQADIYIDPWRPVDKALITHGHADHARGGSKWYLTHTMTKHIMHERISSDLNIQSIGFGERLSINNVHFSFHPAGHIIGSAQIRVEYKGEVWVASGDYKTEYDGISETFELVPCHTFITECTFGLPIYDWKPQQETFSEINSWWKENLSNGKTSLIYGYSLGKAQRIIQNLDLSLGKIYTHGAIENINEVFRRAGLAIVPTERITRETDIKEVANGIVVAPPSAYNSVWTKKFKNTSHASASGWMNLRGARRRRGVDRGFILSDHADWKGLNDVIDATGAENVIATHGYTSTFAQWLKSKGINAITENTAFEGESAEEVKEESEA